MMHENHPKDEDGKIITSVQPICQGRWDEDFQPFYNAEIDPVTKTMFAGWKNTEGQGPPCAYCGAPSVIWCEVPVDDCKQILNLENQEARLLCAIMAPTPYTDKWISDTEGITIGIAQTLATNNYYGHNDELDAGTITLKQIAIEQGLM